MNDQEKIWNNLYKSQKEIWKKENSSLPDIMEDKDVLECGVGNGKTLSAILKQKPKSIIAIDFSKEAINICKEKFKAQAKFVKLDLTKINFKENSFDIVVLYYTLSNLSPDKQTKTLSLIYKSIKKGGHLIFQDFAKGDIRQNSNKNNLFYHFFSLSEIKSFFKDFKIISLEKIKYKPYKNSIQDRYLIKGVFQKI